MCITAIKAAKIYDGSLNKPAENATLVFSGEKILDIIPLEDQARLAQHNITITLDYSNKYLIPGLIDAHVHTMLPGNGMTGETVWQTCSLGEMQIIAANNGYKALKNGVTTLRDCGSIPDVSLSLKSAVEKGLWNGPDMVVCGAPLTSTGGHIHYMGGEVDGPEEVRKMVRLNHKLGADFTKIIATGGGTKRVVPKGMNLTPTEIQMAIDESHRMYMQATAHINAKAGLEQIIDMGIDGVEHGYFSAFDGSVDYDPYLAEKMVKKDIVVCETIQVLEPSLRTLEALPHKTPLHLKEIDRLRLFQERLYEMHRYMIQDGISFIGGSDAGWKDCPFGQLWEGLWMLGQCGMNNADLLHCATGKAADFLRLSNKLGYLRPGLQADFVILTQDPMVDIRNLNQVQHVYKKGIKI